MCCTYYGVALSVQNAFFQSTRLPPVIVHAFECISNTGVVSPAQHDVVIFVNLQSCALSRSCTALHNSLSLCESFVIAFFLHFPLSFRSLIYYNFILSSVA